MPPILFLPSYTYVLLFDNNTSAVMCVCILFFYLACIQVYKVCSLIKAICVHKQLLALLHVISCNSAQYSFQNRALYFQIMGSTNTTLVRYSEFHVGGYPTIFNRICFTHKKLQYIGFLQHDWRQSIVSNLESVNLFWCLHFDYQFRYQLLIYSVSPKKKTTNFYRTLQHLNTRKLPKK